MDSGQGANLVRMPGLHPYSFSRPKTSGLEKGLKTKMGVSDKRFQKCQC